MKSTMVMPEYQQDKAMFAYDYVSLKNEELNRKHLKKRHLGDLHGRYKSADMPSTPDLVGSLVSLDFPETRAINLTTADNIINNQSQKIRQTFKKNQREAILDEWARPPSVLVENHKNENDTPDSRPQTAPGYHGLNHTPFQNGPSPRPYSTGSFRTPPRKPPQPSGFMWVKMKQKGQKMKEVNFRRITEEIHDYWENEDKAERERRRRAKSENLKRHDSFSGQWLSFAGSESAGLVDAFTGEGSDPDQYYSIDGKVGSSVARQLRAGTKLHIGRNGELQSETLRVKEWRRSSKKRDSVEDALKNFHKPSQDETEELKKPTCLIPLDWSEQVVQPDVKVLGISQPASPPIKLDMCERHPVVYNKLIPGNSRPKIQIKLDKYCIRHRSRAKRNVDGTESLSQRITRITVDDLTKGEEDNDAMTMDEYQELLKQKLESVRADGGVVVESGHPDLMQRLSPNVENQMNREKSVSLSSLGKTSNASDLTVEKPPSPTLLPPESHLLSKERVPTAVPSSRHGSVRHQKSAPAVSVRRPAGASSHTSNPGMRPKSEMTRRISKPPFSGHSSRAQSSTGHRPNFDQLATPRSVQSPRVKRGQFYRTGVPSINTAPREGEQEYIKISHQIPSPYHPLGHEMSSNLAGEGEGDEDRSSSPGSMKGSVSSLDVLRGVDENHNIQQSENCSCTEDAKRVMSAALSGISLPHQDQAPPFISIPTAARISPGGVSDTHSELDVIRASQLSFTQQSYPEDDDFDQYSEKDNLSELDELDGTPPLTEGSDLQIEDSNQGNQNGRVSDIVEADASQNPVEEDIIINRDDGLLLDDGILSKHSEGSVSTPRGGDGKRTVTFKEDLLEPLAPTCTPQSTPRDSQELFSDMERLEEDQELKGAEVKRKGEATEQLKELREQIKMDLRQTKEEAERDLREMDFSKN